MASLMNRRELLIQIAGLAAVAGSVGRAEAEHVHQEVAAAKAGAYTARAFDAHEEKTLRALCERIVPGATEGGAFEYIDLLSANNERLAAIYHRGLAWLDRESVERAQALFVDAALAEQTALLDLIAFRDNSGSNPDLGPGIRFFDWTRRMTVDAYYTSAAGIRDIGFQGNGVLPEFTVPQEAMDYALKRSGLS